jgi:hypothetical protein
VLRAGVVVVKSAVWVLGAACVAVSSVAAPASAATARTVYTAHISVSGVSGALPAGATVSVLQYCAPGSSLVVATTRQAAAEADQELDPHVRLASREFWPAGSVSRYRVVKAVSAAHPLPLVGAVLCTGTVASTATTSSGSGATDLRVWGPAPARLALVNATVVAASDSLESDDAFATVVTAAGVASSRGSLADAVQAVQKATQTEGLGSVATVGRTSRRVARGRFVSMRSAYTYVSDLTKKITTTTT